MEVATPPAPQPPRPHSDRHWSCFVHPILFGFYPVFFAYTTNTKMIEPAEMLYPAAVILAVVLGLLLLAWAKTREPARVALTLSILLVWLFSYGQVKEWTHVFAHSRFLPTWTLGAVLACVWVWRTRRNMRRITTLVNVMALALLLSASSQLVVRLHESSKKTRNQATGSTRVDPAHLTPKLGYLPSIFYIGLDAYTGSDALREVYHEDNSDFLAYLKRRGFYVAEKSRANYVSTFSAIPAVLNMCYDPGDRSWQSLLRDNQVSRLLEDLGYELVVFESLYPIHQPIPADIRLPPGVRLPSSLDRHLWSMSAWNPVHLRLSVRRGLFRSFADEARELTLYAEQNIPVFAKEPRPVFVFAHINCPHPPYVFGRQGEPVSPRSLPNPQDQQKQDRRGYADQVAYISKAIQGTIDAVLDNSEKPPVIILQADHGGRLTGEKGKPETRNLKEWTTVLSAFHLPGNGAKLLYPEISPVNDFRVVLNHCFGADYELLEDKTYMGDYRIDVGPDGQLVAVPAGPSEAVTSSGE